MLKTFSGRRASQNEYELKAFITLLQSRGVRRYLEIGARHGDTFHEVMTSLEPGSYGVAVDLPGGLWGVSKSVKSLHKVITDLRRKGYDVSPILGDSTSAEILSCIAAHGPFDAILIDGDHSYEGVKADWLNFKDSAPVVAFHDIVGNGETEKVYNSPVEVPRLWAEIEGEHETETFVAPDSTMGIGVCFLR